MHTFDWNAVLMKRRQALQLRKQVRTQTHLQTYDVQRTLKPHTNVCLYVPPKERNRLINIGFEALSQLEQVTNCDGCRKPGRCVFVRREGDVSGMLCRTCRQEEKEFQLSELLEKFGGKHHSFS